MDLFFDTETSGLINFKAPNSHSSQPWIVQLAAILSTKDRIYGSLNCLLKPLQSDWTITQGAYEAHKISIEDVNTYGLEGRIGLGIFTDLASMSTTMIAHNNEFDWRLLDIMATRLESINQIILMELKKKSQVCTMKSTTELCKLPATFKGRGKYKWPKLEELHRHLFKCDFNAHDAMEDVKATRRCYYKLVEERLI